MRNLPADLGQVGHPVLRKGKSHKAEHRLIEAG